MHGFLPRGAGNAVEDDARDRRRRAGGTRGSLWTTTPGGPGVDHSWTVRGQREPRPARPGDRGHKWLGLWRSSRRGRIGGTCPRRSPVATPIDPTSAGFLLAENRNMPMHVAGLHLFEKPEGAGREYARQMFEQMRDEEEIAPLFLKHPYRSIRTGGQLVWKEDQQFDIEHHVRHS